MFQNNIEIIKNTFEEYKGQGMYIALFLVGILYILLKEKDKKMKILFVFYPLLTLLITLNPIFNKLIGHIFKSSTYWRVYWIIPLGIVIAYASILFIKENQEKSKKVLCALGIVIIIMASGKLIYNNANFYKTGNLYKLPDESILVAQLIGEDDAEYKKAIVPETLVAYIRQIDASIELLYKRDPEGKYDENPAWRELNSGNVSGITKIAKSKKCNYIVFKKATVLTEKMEDYGFEKLNETPNYAIYKYIEQ